VSLTLLCHYHCRVTTIVMSLPLSCHYHCRVTNIVVSLPLSCHCHCHVTTIVMSLHCHGQPDTDEFENIWVLLWVTEIGLSVS